MELMVIGILNVFVLETMNYLTYDNATFGTLNHNTNIRALYS